MTKTVLQEADEIIYGEKAHQYGDASSGLGKVAAQWRLYIFQKYGYDVMLKPEDVCFMMADYKKVRQMTNPKRDNIVDAAGYIGLVEKVGGGQ